MNRVPVCRRSLMHTTIRPKDHSHCIQRTLANSRTKDLKQQLRDEEFSHHAAASSFLRGLRISANGLYRVRVAQRISTRTSFDCKRQPQKFLDVSACRKPTSTSAHDLLGTGPKHLEIAASHLLILQVESTELKMYRTYALLARTRGTNAITCCCCFCEHAIFFEFLATNVRTLAKSGNCVQAYHGLADVARAV